MSESAGKPRKTKWAPFSDWRHESLCQQQEPALPPRQPSVGPRSQPGLGWEVGGRHLPRQEPRASPCAQPYLAGFSEQRPAHGGPSSGAHSTWMKEGISDPGPQHTGASQVTRCASEPGSHLDDSAPGDSGHVWAHLWPSQLGHPGLEAWGPGMCPGRPQTVTLPTWCWGHGAGQGSDKVPHESLILSHPCDDAVV